jgi:hypothetical protein
MRYVIKITEGWTDGKPRYVGNLKVWFVRNLWGPEVTPYNHKEDAQQRIDFEVSCDHSKSMSYFWRNAKVVGVELKEIELSD